MGVADDGSICGVRTEGLQEWLIDTVAGRYVSPHILPKFEIILTTDAKAVAVISVPAGVAKPYVVQCRHDRAEKIYVRYGNTCQLASRERLARLFQSGGLTSTEKFQCTAPPLPI